MKASPQTGSRGRVPVPPEKRFLITPRRAIMYNRTQPFEPNWNSLATHITPQWFKDAKFGIYTHWGPYSVPSFGFNGSWYPHFMYGQFDTGELSGKSKDRVKKMKAYHKHHVETYGDPSDFGYKEFIPMFTAEKFDAEEWADLFRKAGAQYAGPVAEHHDGFAMWDSKVTKWNAANMGPKRDIVGQLEKAYRKQGMKFIATFHHSYNWWFFPTYDKRFDCSDPAFAGLYSRPHAEGEMPDNEYLDIWYEKIKEVIDGYEPDLLWFDFGLGRIKETHQKKMMAYYYNKEALWDRELAITFKTLGEAMNVPPMTGIADIEVGKMTYLTHNTWLSDTNIDTGTGWTYVKDLGYKSPERLIHNLVDRVSKNGHLLLNVGPRPDGSIPAQARRLLLEMGSWLEVNGEAIYGTTPWFRSGEGPTKVNKSGDHFNEANEVRFTASDIRFTTKGHDIFAICLGIPGDQIRIESLRRKYADEIEAVSVLGSDRTLNYRMDGDGMLIDVPEEVTGKYATVFKITCKPADE